PRDPRNPDPAVYVRGRRHSARVVQSHDPADLGGSLGPGACTPRLFPLGGAWVTVSVLNVSVTPPAAVGVPRTKVLTTLGGAWVRVAPPKGGPPPPPGGGGPPTKAPTPLGGPGVRVRPQNGPKTPPGGGGGGGVEVRSGAGG